MGSGAHGFAVVMSVDEMQAAVDEAHRHGRLVGAHVHGSQGIDASLEAGVDTIEHATGITAEQASRAADLGVALVPTLSAISAILEHADELAPDLRTRAEEVSSMASEGIRTAIERGARVLAGTDAGTPFNPPGLLVREMEILAGLGLGTLGAVAAATSAVADTFGLAHTGRIQPEATADLLHLVDDPQADLDVLARPQLIVQSGSSEGP
jgi:imidazolonepropionase-like amidohydrolase